MARQSKFDQVMQAIPEDQQTKVVDALQILVKGKHSLHHARA